MATRKRKPARPRKRASKQPAWTFISNDTPEHRAELRRLAKTVSAFHVVGRGEASGGPGNNWDVVISAAWSKDRTVWLLEEYVVIDPREGFRNADDDDDDRESELSWTGGLVCALRVKPGTFDDDAAWEAVRQWLKTGRSELTGLSNWAAFGSPPDDLFD